MPDRIDVGLIIFNGFEVEAIIKISECITRLCFTSGTVIERFERSGGYGLTLLSKSRINQAASTPPRIGPSYRNPGVTPVTAFFIFYRKKKMHDAGSQDPSPD